MRFSNFTWISVPEQSTSPERIPRNRFVKSDVKNCTGDFTCLTFTVTNNLNEDKKLSLGIKVKLSISPSTDIDPAALMRFTKQ